MRVIVHTIPASPWLPYLQTRFPQLEVVEDPFYNPMNTVQQRCWNAYECYLHALDLQGTAAAFQIEDDIILTKNFWSKALAAVAERPDTIIQFFSMRPTDTAKGSHWDSDFMSHLCTYMPAGSAPLVAAFGRLWARRSVHPGGSDLMVADWLKATQQRYWMHVPSLVQHREAKSRLGPRSSKRRSLTFVDPDDA